MTSDTTEGLFTVASIPLVLEESSVNLKVILVVSVTVHTFILPNDSFQQLQ